MEICPACLEGMKKYGGLPTHCATCGADRSGSSSEDFFRYSEELTAYRAELRQREG